MRPAPHRAVRSVPVALAALLAVACSPPRAGDSQTTGGDPAAPAAPAVPRADRLVLEPADTDLQGLAWMTGHWAYRRGDLRSEEHWTQPAAGTMFGVNRLMSGERTVFFEYLRIEKTPEGIVYLASPGGRDPATPFPLVEQGDRRAVFENLEHDFPQRITYWIDEEGSLRATAWGEGEGEPREEQFSWRPATLP